MSHYSWRQYNTSYIKLSKKLIKFNQKHKINYIEKGLYNHIRDLFCLTILLRKKNTKKTNILDYGSNLLALSNIKSKINVNDFNFDIYDPFSIRNKRISKPFKINLIAKSHDIRKKKFNIINFGSSIQYIKKINVLKKEINYKSVSTIIITNTPITLNKPYKSNQSNHLNLLQNIYNLKFLIKFFNSIKFKLIFISRNEDKYIACKTKKKETYSLNLIFIKN